VGQQVDREMVIGLSGNSGRSSGPHLHFGIRINPFNRSDDWNGYSNPSMFFQAGPLFQEVWLKTDEVLIIHPDGPFSVRID